MKMPALLLGILLLLISSNMQAQTYNMVNGSITTCSGTHRDPGGASNYPTNNVYTQTIYPATSGQKVRLTFSQFSLENNYDFLNIYDGNSTTAPQINRWTGTTSPGTVTSTAADGSLTLYFYSDPYTVSTGWQAAISCVASAPANSYNVYMWDGSMNVCSANFYDDWGPSANYYSDQDHTLTLYPATAGAKLRVNFTSFSIENASCATNYDWLRIYNGNSTAAPQIGCYTGTGSPGLITSSAADGSLTFRFKSDGGTEGPGWAATLSCYNPCTTPTLYTVTGGGCVGSGTVGLNGSQTGATYTLWRDGAAVTSTGGTGGALNYGVQTFSGTYTVVASGGSYCTTTMSGSAVISGPAPADGTISSGTGTSACVNENITITPSGGTGTPYYWVQTPAGAGSWNVHSGAAANAAGNAFTFATAAAGTYRVMAQWQTACGYCTGCTHPYIDITVAPPPSAPASATGSPSTVCAGQSVTFTATGSGVSYKWYTAASGGTAISTANPFTTTASGSGAISLYAAMVDANGCESVTRTQATVTVTTTPTVAPASFTVGATSPCANASSTYTVASVSGATGYNWSYSGTGATFSATTTGTSQNITFAPNATNGTLSVSATNNCGSGPARTLAITLKPAPLANAGADASISCAGAVKLGGSSNNETITTEAFGNSHSEVTSATSGWRIRYLYGSSPGNRTSWWISNTANGYGCAVSGSSLVQRDPGASSGIYACDYAWDDGTMDEVAYRVTPVDASLYTHVYMTFDYLVSGEVGGTTVYDYMQVVYSTDGGTIWTPVNAGSNNGTYSLNANMGVNNGYFSSPPTPSAVNTTIEFPTALAGDSFLFGFRWYNDGATGYLPGMVIDNIVIHGVADYNWGGSGIAFGGNTKTPAVTAPDTYTLTVTAGNGCTATDQVTITQSELNASVSSDNALTCTTSGAIDITNPSGGDQAWVIAPLTSTAPANTSIAGNATYTGDRLRLTSAAASQAGSFIISNPNNYNAGAFDLEFDFYIGGATSADGFSISYAGDIPAITGGSESGYGSGLRIIFDSYNNGAAGYQYGGSNQTGIYLVYNNAVLAFSGGTAWRNAIHTAKISVNTSNQLTLLIDGVSTLTYNLGSTGYAAANKTGWTWALSARTGGAYDEHSIRNMILTVYDQYEYSIGSGWNTSGSFTPGAGSYTPQIRLKGNVCTKNLPAQTITAPPAISAIPTVTNTGPKCIGEPVDLAVAGLAPAGKVANLAGTATMGGNLVTAASNNFTMEFWVKPTRTRTSTAESNTGVISLANEQSLAIFPFNGSGNAGAGVSVGTNGISVCEHGSSYFPSPLVYDMAISDWTHVAIVYTNRTPSLYVNGNFVKTGLQSSRPTVYASIGTGSSYGYFNGQLDNIRIWNYSRSATEIRNNMYLETPASGSGLTAHYTFNNSNANATVGANMSNNGATFTNAAHYTYTWAGTNAPSPANTTETRTSGTYASSGSYVITVTPGAAGCANSGGSTTTVEVDQLDVTAINANVSPAPAIGANDYLWTGKTNINWNNTGNWFQYNGTSFVQPASLPTASRDVYIVDPSLVSCISTTNAPTVNVTANSRALYIGNGAVLNSGAGQTLNIAGHYRNYGTFNASTGIVNFNGTTNQTLISGWTSGSTNAFNKLYINNTGTGTEVNVTGNMRALTDIQIQQGVLDIQNNEVRTPLLDISPSGSLNIGQSGEMRVD